MLKTADVLDARKLGVFTPAVTAGASLRRIAATTALATGVIVGMMVFQAGGAQAQTTDWTGTASSDFAIDGNWNNLAPVVAGTANILTNGANAPVVGVDTTVATVNVAGATLSLNAGITLSSTLLTLGTGGTLAGGAASNYATSTFQMTGGTVSAGATITAATAFDLQAGTVAGVLAGGGAVTKSTAGAVTLSGANSYSGGTTVSDGTLTVGNNSALGNVANALTVSGGTLDITGFNVTQNGGLTLTGGAITGGTLTSSGTFGVQAGTISSILEGTGGLAKTTAGAVTLSGANTYTGGTTVSDGTLTLSGAGTLGANTNALTVSGGTLDLGTLNITQNGGLTLTGGTISNGTLTSSGTFGVQAGTVSAVLAGTGGLAKTTAGAVTLSGANTYTGATTISDGTLTLSGAGTLGANTNALTVSGGTLDLGTLNITQNGGLTLTGGTISNGTLTSSGTFGVQAGTVSAVLDGTGGLTKTTAGSVTLSGANTYTGGTTISAGTLAVTNNSALGTGAVSIAGGGTLQAGANGLVLTNAITLTGGTSNIDTNGNTLTISTGMAGDALNKIGAGTLVLSAANTFTGGSTVSAGTLQVAAAGSLASGVIVNSGATLQNDNVITGAVTNSGTASSTGTITGTVTNAGTFNASGTINGAVVNNSGAFTTTGLLTVTGSFTNNAGATLAVTGGDLTGLTGLTNRSTVTIGDGRTLSAGTIDNLGGTISIGAGSTLRGTANTLNNSATINVATAGSIIDAGAINNLAAGVINFNGPGGTATLSTGSTIVNDGAINVIGGNVAVTGNLTNQGAGTVAVSGGNLTGIGTLSVTGGTVSVSASRLLSATTMTIGSGGTITSAGSLSAATIANLGRLTSTGSVTATTVFNNSGTANLAGTVTTPSLNNSGTLNVVGGDLVVNAPLINTGIVALTAGRSLSVSSFSNSGTLNMQNNVANNAVNIAGAYTGNGGVLLDVDIASARADRIIINGGGSSGASAVAINQVLSAGSGLGVTQNDILVISGASGARFTAANAVPASTPSPFVGGGGQLISAPNSIVQYWFGETSPNSGTFVVRPDLNVAAASSFVASVSSALSSINAYSEPASAFISGPSDPGPNTLSIGAWGRGRGGRLDTDSTSRVSSPNGVSRSFDLTNRTDFNGFQLGIDLGLYNINGTGWTTNVGIHGGKVDAQVRATGVALDLEQPFYGVYAAVRNGSGLAFDVLFRRDQFDMKLTSQAANLSKEKLKADGYSGLASLAQRFNITDTIYIDPSIALLYSRAEVDNLRVGADSSVAWHPIESITGRIGVQVGTFYQPTKDIVISPYVALSAWREFSGKTEAVGNFGTVSFPTTTNRVGTYGQASLGMAVSSVTPGLSGFVRGDLRFGERVEGFAFNGGLRYQF